MAQDRTTVDLCGRLWMPCPRSSKPFVGIPGPRPWAASTQDIAVVSIARISSRGMGGASWAATKARDVNLGRSHVVVHVVIRAFETARNRSNRTLDAANRAQSLRKRPRWTRSPRHPTAVKVKRQPPNEATKRGARCISGGWSSSRAGCRQDGCREHAALDDESGLGRGGRRTDAGHLRSE